MNYYRCYFKRFIDLLIALILIIFTSPIFIILIIILSITNSGTPFFIQKRPGKFERIFRIIKFKTMKDLYDESGVPLPAHIRISLVGNVIRKLSLDELPQLINVIKGDMSLVGPRPLLIEYLTLYNQFQNRRHEVRPGITGWAQVNGRNAISWEKKFEYDVWYTENLSLILDLKIFLLTFKRVIYRAGINKSKELTMDPFRGSY